MRKSHFTLLTPFAATLLLVACDSGPSGEQTSTRSARVELNAPSADSPASSAAAAARAVGEIAASGARAAAVSAGDQVDDEAPSREAALRAQLLGLDKKKKAEEAAQAEPEEPSAEAKSRPRRRASRAAAPEPAPIDDTPIGLSDGEFQDAVGGWRGIQGCIAENAGYMESRNGAMRVSFQIAADGSVSDCTVLDTSNAVAAAIAPCVQKKARRIRFPTFAGDEATKVAKFVF